nr:inclusion body protein [Chrysanthemum yellow edge associated virus 2]
METMMKQLQNNIKQKKESIQAAKQRILQDEQELNKMEQMFALFNNQEQETQQTNTQASTSSSSQTELRPQKPLQLPKQPTLKQKEEFDHQTNTIIQTLVNQSTQKESWYVVFKGRHPGIYSNWAVVAEQVNGFPGASYKKYKTKEEAEAAYKKTWSEMIQAQNNKLTQDRMKLHKPVYTVLGKIKTPQNPSPTYTIKEFQESWTEIIEYKEEYILRHFYPRKRRVMGPKAVITPEASPEDAWRFFSLGLIDTIYINPKKLSILKLFPEKIQAAVKRYQEKVAKNNEIFLLCKTSYPIYTEDNFLLVPSVGLVQMGISNGVYPEKEEIGTHVYEFHVYINSLLQTFYHSTNFGLGETQESYIKVDYSGKTHLIYSKCRDRPLGKFELRELGRFEENFHTLKGFFENANEEVLTMLCDRLRMESPQHKCSICKQPDTSAEDGISLHEEENDVIIDNSSNED